MTVYFGAEQTPEAKASGVLVIFSPTRSICITIIVSRNSVKLHCFDTKYMIWYRIFFENSTIILSMNAMQNFIYEKQFC